MEILRTEKLCKVYITDSNQFTALKDINIVIEEGETIAIVGTSGSGKTTLLNLLGGLDHPTSGSVTVRGYDLGQMTSEERTLFRRRNIGFVFQTYNLMPMLNVYENILLPLELDGTKPDALFIEELIKSLKLNDKMYAMPKTLSGGEKQRVAIGRALAAKPAVILADEPTGNLDSRTGSEVMGLLKVMADRYHQTMLIVTHDEEVAQMADRIIRIEDGMLWI